MELTNRGLFLCGERGIGKSTAISALLKDRQGYGFYIQRVIEDGRKLGFTINRYTGGEYQVNTSLSTANESAMFLDFRRGKRDFNMKVFMERFLEYTDNIPDGAICLLDEIGGLEFSDNRLIGRLEDLVERCLPVGVYKSDESFISFCSDSRYASAKLNRDSFAKKLNNLGILFHVKGSDLNIENCGGTCNGA